MIQKIGQGNFSNGLQNAGNFSIDGEQKPKIDFGKTAEALGKYLSNVDQTQKAADASIQDLLTGKNNDLNAVVSQVAKADMSFKLLVGVRNQLLEAYKQTMNMQI